MCGKAAVSHLARKDVFAWATSLTPPRTLPENPADRINISPSRLRRKSEPDSMLWETLLTYLPTIHAQGDIDQPSVVLHSVWNLSADWHARLFPRCLLPWPSR